MDESVSYADIRRTALQTERKLLKSVTLFDVYRGDKIPEGKKQYALNFVLQNLEQTLTDEDVEKIMTKLMGAFEHKHNASLR